MTLVKNAWKSLGTTGQIFLGIFLFLVVAKHVRH